ncbi:DUF397 domain-containing protein [Streptomyces europaeiscabiei]|uniref:DUF397 domain-containing protein n=1 Tax=Streptomyces europaeiscabiei TaxID=146819 RepID=A0ABU4NIU7_9ACTN|nr:DUF397 domain-containing protein [Streptomyces europaeiscabiei]MDX2530144.1 DUF397 domain-containing protein [Streptomyces europaeiscabiei]MDX2766209.1 DUF397 domain-containing protein [Streptomyces europaeiscabiei]MDX2775301.1 DUF397 domain-containing protein [Streptomyces europaeiscabiei]MDX3544619.1 DUF397 domain-containing protein [Streptomyces europaeiscabiei]MDX3553969.1 DUF397 domain-containing protein [Streptomyces europaeiscabiei]
MRSIPDHVLSSAVWHKSSYSEGGGGECLEVAANHPTHIPVRDSKTPLGPKLVFRAEAWSAFVEDLKSR